MNMKTIMSVLLKNSTFVACVSLCSTFAHKLCGSVIVEAVQGAFPVPREGETNAASGIIFTGAHGCKLPGFKCTEDKNCCSPRKCEGRCMIPNPPITDDAIELEQLDRR